MANVFEPEFDSDQERPGFTYRRAKLGPQVGTMLAPEVNLYPDSGKAMAATRAPGAGGEGFQESYRRSDTTDYWEDESPPSVAGE